MGDDVPGPSQSAQVTPQTAELKAFMAELDRRLAVIEARRDRALQMSDLLAGASEPPLPVPGPRHRKPKRDRPDWLKVIPGGLAAFAPLALLFHGGAPAAWTAVWRWVWGSARARVVTTVLAVSVGAALGVPSATAGATVHPHPHRHPHSIPRHYPDHDRSVHITLPG